MWWAKPYPLFFSFPRAHIHETMSMVRNGIFDHSSNHTSGLIHMVGPVLCLYSLWQTPTQMLKPNSCDASSGKTSMTPISFSLRVLFTLLVSIFSRAKTVFSYFSVIWNLLTWITKWLIKERQVSSPLGASVSQFEKEEQNREPARELLRGLNVSVHVKCLAEPPGISKGPRGRGHSLIITNPVTLGKSLLLLASVSVSVNWRGKEQTEAIIINGC